MNDKQKDEFLYDIYYKENRLLGRDRLFHYTYKTLGNNDISRRYIMGWLKKQKVHQVYADKKKPTSIRPIISKKPGALLQMDLIDFSKNPSKEGFKYILNVIDVFSRKVWLQGIKKKTIENVIPELNYIVKEIEKDYKISIIQSDRGGEFNIAFPSIKHIQSAAYTPQAQSLIERSNGTLKKILNKYLYNQGSTLSNPIKKRWDDDIILEIENIYNSTLNTTIGMTPDEAYELKGQDQIDLYEKQKLNHSKSFKEIDTLLNIGDTVRLLIPTGKIKSKGEPLYSDQLYKIIKVTKGNNKSFTIPRYKIQDKETSAILPGSYPISKLNVVPNGTVETR